LARGGNAVDAAVAACLTLCVVNPQSVGFAGYGGNFVAYVARLDRVVAVDFDSRAPLEYRPELFASPDARRFGYLAVTVPGVVAGLDLALRHYGTITFAEALAHAADLAERGFVPDPICHKEITDFTARTDDASRRALFADAHPPRPEQHWVPRDLVKTIRLLIDHGPDVLYKGELADRIVSQVRDKGGILSKADFETYQAQVVTPLHVRYRDHDLYTPPLPSGGITAFQTLKILSHLDPGDFKRLDARCLHLVAGALKIGWADRDLLGDPDFVTVPVDELLSDDRARRAASQILSGQVASTRSRADSGVHTVNVCCVDRDLNTVSLTATHGFMFGAQRVVEGTGLVLGHGMSRFDYLPNHANAPAPAKRMQHNMAPCIAMKDGKPRFAFGLPGGTRIISVTAQIAVQLIDMGLPPETVTSNPRLHTEGAEPITVTDSLSPEVAAGLESLGHTLSREKTVGGPANALAIDQVTGHVRAGSTERQDVWTPTDRGNV
jgi:gamma-glutamyltranspeptidase/glutathione hydrolase